MGVVCRHEFPLKFLSIRLGENLICHFLFICLLASFNESFLPSRFSYIMYILERLLECSQSYHKVHILYDVACSLMIHLKV